MEHSISSSHPHHTSWLSKLLITAEILVKLGARIELKVEAKQHACLMCRPVASRLSARARAASRRPRRRDPRAPARTRCRIATPRCRAGCEYTAASSPPVAAPATARQTAAPPRAMLPSSAEAPRWMTGPRPCSGDRREGARGIERRHGEPWT
jgi:hypothetical protein